MAINPQQKLAGLLVPVFALRRPGDLGIGDTTAMREAIDFCQENKIGVLQILPINETGGDHSPYNAISSRALEPALITVDPAAVPGLSNQAMMEIANPQKVSLLQAGAVQYPLVKKLKLDLLLSAFQKFEAEQLSHRQWPDFLAFQKQHQSWLPAYTLFRALVQEHEGHSAWTSWPQELQTLSGAQSWLAACPAADRLSFYRRFAAFVQWVAFKQWREVKAYADSRSVRLMGDIPFGVSRYSADVWANRHLFDLDWSGGAPPETLFQQDLFLQKWGQNWGLPLYDWPNHEKEDYAWWRQRVQGVGEFFHDFRIDHVLGFFRIYAFPWIPERNGEFVDLTRQQAAQLTGGRLPHFIKHPDEPPELAEENRQQGEKLLRMVLKAAGNLGVVAEDLGMVPAYVRPLLQKLGIPGFYIPQFERQEESREFKPQAQIPPLTLGTYATHDHAPLKAFYEDLVERWHGSDGHFWWLEVQRLMRYLGWDENHPPTSFTPELHRALVCSLLESPCWLAMFMITDWLGTNQRFNAPGSSEESNWSQRLDRPLGQYKNDPLFCSKLEEFSRLVVQSHRQPSICASQASS